MGVMVPSLFCVIFVCVITCVTMAGGNGNITSAADENDDVKAKLSELLQEFREMKKETMEKLAELKNDTKEIKMLLKNGHGNSSAVHLAQCQNFLQQDILALRNQFEQLVNNVTRPTSCSKAVPKTKQGVYKIWIRGRGEPRNVFCDDEWTVIQKRQDGSVDFYRGWDDYKAGFGNASGEYWLGLQTVHEMTSKGEWQLQVDLGDWENNTAHVLYDRFSIGPESDRYRLSNLRFREGLAGDSLNKHKKKPFSTHDKDHDLWSKNCAMQFHGAWWYTSCLTSNLNGQYKQKHKAGSDGLIWKTWKGFSYSVKTAVMKIRPV